MEMTIEESIRISEDYQEDYQKWAKHYGIPGSELDDAINKLLDVAKKYQKIEQIMNQEQTQWGVIKDTWLYKEIREVIEDGMQI